MTSLQQPTTCPTYWRHATVCYTHYGSCAVMASQTLRYMMSFVLPSSRSWLIAKFHYTDPTGPARTQRSFAAKKSVRVRAGPVGSVWGPCRVRVVEFSYYCAPTWSGACSAADRAKLESFVSRCKRLEYCSSEVPTYSDLTDEADDTLQSNHG